MSFLGTGCSFHLIIGLFSTLSGIFELRERESFSWLGIFKLLKINLTEAIDVVMYIAL